MDIEKTLQDLIPDNMLRRSETTLESLLSPIRNVLHQRKMPLDSFTDLQIELLLKVLSSMDTDKDLGAARVGEREGRVVSPYVEHLAAGFNHGIGRSGHLTAPQPKAPGASLMQQAANQVALDAMRKFGLHNVHSGIVFPLSTGMTIAISLSALRREKGVKRVLFPRIDHASPKRGIELSGLETITTSTTLEGDAVQADLGDLEREISKNHDIAILATTTFFPPRTPDPIKEIAKMCQAHDIPLVVNNAYGVQSTSIMKTISSAIDAGKVDVIIQSGDKNFMTPVGSAIAVSPDEEIMQWISETYAGRASAAPVVQTFAALLAHGLKGYEALRNQQVESKTRLEKRMTEIASDLGQRILDVNNEIAVAMTLDGIDANDLGGRLYNRRVTGPRAIEAGEYGSCIDGYPHSYIVMNAAIGASKNDVENATTKLYKEASSHTGTT
ncbi:MAG: O-phosphoseryl-tRNA(Sec) selenium transferase [Candidatus Thorarchaeota archaeon]|nr:O-phosphoseryl-tRNA(Sec) selenium transferase [Candidatus Thorarchaeota archaeon]